MNTMDDLREAILSTVVVRPGNGTVIIGSDERRVMEWLLDFRALLLQPRWLNYYAELFWETYASQYPFQVCGMETAAISMVAAIVMKGVERGTPVNGLYIRKSRKRQGLLKQVEGTINSEKIILVDDLINSGSTFNKQIKILSGLGAHVSDIFVLMAFRDDAAYEHISAHITKFFTLRDIGLPMSSASSEPNIDTFETLWRFSSGSPLRNFVHEKSSPVLNGDRVYFGTDSEGFLALNQKDGSVAWKFDTHTTMPEGAIFSSPIIYEDMLFVGCRNGTLYALDKHSGKELWRYEDADRIESTPGLAVHLGRLFVGIEFGLNKKRGAIVALDIKNGNLLWKAELPGRVHSTPYYIRKETLVVIADDAGNVCGYNAKTGSIQFHFVARGGVYGGFAYDAKRRIVYFGSMEGACYGLFVPTGTTVYAKEALSIHSTPLITNDILYFSSLDKHIYAIDLQTGNERWRFATQGRIFASPTIKAGSLWCGSNDGKLYELDPDTGRFRSSFQLSERIVNTIAFNEDTGLLYVSTQANELYCLKKNAAKPG